jgi:transaldolase
MKIKIYADGSKLEQILDSYQNNKKVTGFTTNPSLMKKAGVTDYLPFVKEVTSKVTDLPISFEIFADEYEEMKEQILKLSSIASNIYVKVPITNTKGEPTYKLCKEMSDLGIKLNVTAIFTQEQIDNLNQSLNPDVDAVISIFAGRIADTGINPVPLMEYAINNKKSDKHEILWASTREVYSIYEADRIGCDIITVTPDLIDKLSLGGKDLNEYSLETVLMFFNDAKNAGYTL